jgi:hypothetical protein
LYRLYDGPKREQLSNMFWTFWEVEAAYGSFSKGGPSNEVLLSESPEGPGEPPTGMSELSSGFPESHRSIEESSSEFRQQSLRYGQGRDALILLACI